MSILSHVAGAVHKSPGVKLLLLGRRRLVTVHVRPGPGLTGAISIRQGRRRWYYQVLVTAAGVNLAKIGFRPDGDDGADGYDVRLGRGGGGAWCDCRGYAKWNGCVHVDALQALVSAGLLARTRCYGEGPGDE